jgi:hypothetical protein
MMTTTGTHQVVLESYHRCEVSGGFFDTFYETFFAKSPEIPPKFAKTDMEKQKQAVMASQPFTPQRAVTAPVGRRSGFARPVRRRQKRCGIVGGTSPQP